MDHFTGKREGSTKLQDHPDLKLCTLAGVSLLIMPPEHLITLLPLK